MKTTLMFALLFALICATVSCSGAAPIPIPPTPTITLTPLTATLPPATATQPPATSAPTRTPIPSPVEVLWKIKGEPNRLTNPVSLAIGKADNLYIVDGGNNRIQVFDGDGNFVMTWGTTGAGDGEFNFHRGAGDNIGGVALDAQGNVYVADNQNHRIQKFDAQGKFQLKWGSEGKGDGQFISPIEVTVDHQGNVYVIDDGRDEVQKFDSTGKFLLKWSGHGTGDGQLFNTGGIAADGQGNVYVADFGSHRVQKFDSSGKFLLKWGSNGGGNDQFDGPCDVAVDAQGNVYVSSLVPHSETPPRIQKFDSNGKFLARWGSNGVGDGQFISPCGIALDSQGNVYVADVESHNVQKFRQN